MVPVTMTCASSGRRWLMACLDGAAAALRNATYRPVPAARRVCRSRVGLGLVVMWLMAWFAPAPAPAQPRDLQATIGATVASRGSSHYRFEQFVVASADQHRRWRVTVGVPRGTQPAEGWPAFYMLDGNAALSEFDDSLLAALAVAPAPQVLVFIGYDNALRIDLPARTRDYTPLADNGDGADGSARAGGGADAFLEIIERRIRPQLARRVSVDLQRQTLWGHSFGGLFTLYALYSRSGAFQTYAAASPSLWWQRGVLLGEPERRFIEHNAGHPARILLLQGSAEGLNDRGDRDRHDPRVQAKLQRLSGAPADAAKQLSLRLRQQPGLTVEYREFTGLGHGPMLRASLLYSLHAVAGIVDRSGEVRR